MPTNSDFPNQGSNPDSFEGKIEAVLSDTVFELLMADGKLTTNELDFIAHQIGIQNPTPEQLSVIAEKTMQLWESKHKDQHDIPENMKDAAIGAEEVADMLKGTIKGISSAETIGRAESVSAAQEKDKDREI